MNGVTLYQGFKFDPLHYLPIPKDAVYIYIGLTVYFTASFARKRRAYKKGAKVAIYSNGWFGLYR